jgi:REP element-mobilizing transposase RayT
MPRPLRVDFPGATHHAMNRGARRAPVFVDDEACALFVDVLGTLPAKYGVIVHGYALMPNHFHLMLQTPRANLSRAMRHLTGTFTQRLNARHGWDGPVFRGRFRNRLVEDDSYWRHLLAYVHLNPVRAHLVPELDASQWTSHAAYVGLVKRPDWLTVDPLMKLFGSKAAYREYCHEVQVKRRAPPPGFDSDKLWKFESGAAPARAVPATEEAIRAIEDVTGHSFEALATDSAANRRARWLAALWLVDGAGLSLREAGNALGLGRRAVHALVLNGRRTRHESPLAEWLDRLETPT